MNNDGCNNINKDSLVLLYYCTPVLGLKETSQSQEGVVTGKMSAIDFSESAFDGLINLLQEMFNTTLMTKEEEVEKRFIRDKLISDLGGEEAARDIRQAFQLFDKDGDGVVDSAKLGLLLRALGHNPPSPQPMRRWQR